MSCRGNTMTLGTDGYQKEEQKKPNAHMNSRTWKQTYLSDYVHEKKKQYGKRETLVKV